jgi:glycopeptide antibiotics resistance protein
VILFLLDRDDGYPPFGFGLVLALVVATLLFLPVARRLGVRGIAAWLLLAATGSILAMTLTPNWAGPTAGAWGAISCDLSRVGPASIWEYRHVTDASLNVLLFIPLGVVIGAIGRRRTRVQLALAALLLSPAVELTQAVVVPLGRACQGGDLFDNTLGLLIGLALGWGVGRLSRSVADAPASEQPARPG